MVAITATPAFTDAPMAAETAGGQASCSARRATRILGGPFVDATLAATPAQRGGDL